MKDRSCLLGARAARGAPKPATRGRASIVPHYLRLVIQDCAQERIMNLDLTVIGNEAELAKLVHEKADSGACGADHFRQGLLADMGRDRLWGTFLSEICKKQEKAREPLLAGIE